MDQVVNAEACIESEPNYDDRCKCDSDFGCSERLDQEEEYENCAGSSDNGRFGNVWLDDVETLDGTENGLSWKIIQLVTPFGNIYLLADDPVPRYLTVQEYTYQELIHRRS